ncbi:MAG: M24 family metallopeptidase [Nitrososphaerota archaeon]|nr:M24 family metallopeptidase [Nitrososphaerota archaeon]
MNGVESFYRRRREKVLRRAEQDGTDAVIVGKPQNLYYLTGFWGEGLAVLDSSAMSLIVPALERARAEEGVVDTEVIGADRGTRIMVALADRVRGKKCAIDDVDVAQYDAIASRTGAAPIVLPGACMDARTVKDELELKNLREGGRAMDDLYRLAAEVIAPGVSERKVSAALLERMVADGADPPAYESTLNPLIVASGPNGALPHAYTTTREVRDGDFVVVDLVLRYNGYVVDATRTFAVGRADHDMKEAYEAVLGSQREGAKSVRPGARTADVDGVCRRHLAERGYADLFVHSTGHGVGLDVHEPPWLRNGDGGELAEGMVVTVEPGVYVAGRYGVRIEDSIVVAEEPSALTGFARELQVLG